MIASIDSGTDMNCIQEGLIPTQYYEKTEQELFATNKGKLDIEYKLQNVYICQDNYYFRAQFVLVQNMTEPLILGTPFITLLYPFQVTDERCQNYNIRKHHIFPFYISLN